MADRKELVRQEKNLMCHYIENHKKGNKKNLAEIQRLMNKNVQQRRDAR